jgi:predicted O-methyltransferase YrrM
MDYRTFFKSFGGSVRRKNLRSPTRWPIVRASDSHKPVVALPEASGLPAEFIRLDPWEMEFLFLIGKRAKRGILEIGRFNGGSTFVLAAANSSVPIHSIDIAPQDDERLRGLFARHKLGSNVNLITGDSRQHRSEIGAVDVLFIDGDHGYEGCNADLRTWYDNVVPGGYIAFHDCSLDSQVQDVILDFIEPRTDIEIIASPYTGYNALRNPTGTMACLRKKPS